MTESVDTASQIAEYRAYFDSIYIAGIPRLLNDDGAFLSFIAVVTGTDALAGLYAPTKSNGDRFREFVVRYYPDELHAHADNLWKLRNALVHCFHPGPFALTHHASWAHLRSQDGTIVLNAEDFYAVLLSASKAYFSELEKSGDLQRSFLKRISASDGGAMQVFAARPVSTLPHKTS
jgi:hypothetical protein